MSPGDRGRAGGCCHCHHRLRVDLLLPGLPAPAELHVLPTAGRPGPGWAGASWELASSLARVPPAKGAPEPMGWWPQACPVQGGTVLADLTKVLFPDWLECSRWGLSSGLKGHKPQTQKSLPGCSWPLVCSNPKCQLPTCPSTSRVKCPPQGDASCGTDEPQKPAQ